MMILYELYLGLCHGVALGLQIALNLIGVMAFRCFTRVSSSCLIQICYDPDSLDLFLAALSRRHARLSLRLRCVLDCPY